MADILASAQKQIDEAAKKLGQDVPAGTPPPAGVPAADSLPPEPPPPSPPDFEPPKITVPETDHLPATEKPKPPQANKPQPKNPFVRTPPIPTATVVEAPPPPPPASAAPSIPLADQPQAPSAPVVPTVSIPPPKRTRASRAGVILSILLLLFITIPLGVHYVSQRQQLAEVRSRAEGVYPCALPSVCLKYDCSSRTNWTQDNTKTCTGTDTVCCNPPAAPSCDLPSVCQKYSCNPGWTQNTSQICTATDTVCCNPPTMPTCTSPNSCQKYSCSSGWTQDNSKTCAGADMVCCAPPCSSPSVCQKYSCSSGWTQNTSQSCSGADMVCCNPPAPACTSPSVCQKYGCSSGWTQDNSKTCTAADTVCCKPNGNPVSTPTPTPALCPYDCVPQSRCRLGGINLGLGYGDCGAAAGEYCCQATPALCPYDCVPQSQCIPSGINLGLGYGDCGAAAGEYCCQTVTVTPTPVPNCSNIHTTDQASCCYRLVADNLTGCAYCAGPGGGSGNGYWCKEYVADWGVPKSCPRPSDAVWVGNGYWLKPTNPRQTVVSCNPDPGCPGKAPVGCGGPGPTLSPTPTTPPNVTTTPTPTPIIAQCQRIKVYKNGNQVDPSTLQPGDNVFIAVAGQNATKGRIRVNGGPFNETTTKNTSGEYIIPFTIPSGISSFTIEAEVYNNGVWQ